MLQLPYVSIVNLTLARLAAMPLALGARFRGFESHARDQRINMKYKRVVEKQDIPTTLHNAIITFSSVYSEDDGFGNTSNIPISVYNIYDDEASFIEEIKKLTLNKAPFFALKNVKPLTVNLEVKINLD
jgi:hypothetical protein